MYNGEELLESCKDLTSRELIVEALQDECKRIEGVVHKDEETHRYLKFVKNMVYLLHYCSSPATMPDSEFQHTFFFMNGLVEKDVIPESVLDLYDRDYFG